MRRPRAMPMLAAALLLAVAPAVAAGAPEPVSAPAIDASPSSLSFDAAGRAALTWRGLSGSAADAATAFAAGASGVPGSGWTAARALPAGDVSAHAAAYRTGRAALVTWRQQPVRGHRSRSVIALTLWNTATGRFDRTYRLDSGPARRVTYEGPQPTLLSPAVVASASGDVIVAWTRSYPAASAGLWIAERTAAGRLVGKRLLVPRAGQPFLAMGDDGSVLLAWRAGRRVLARVRTPTGRWGTRQVVLTASNRPWTALESLALAARGGTFAIGAVVSVRSAAGVDVGIEAALRSRGGGWRATEVGTFRFSPTGRSVYVTDALRAIPVITTDGRVRVAYPALDAGNVRLALSELVGAPDGIAAQPPQMLSPPDRDVTVEDAAAGPQGRLAAAWFDVSDLEGTQNLAEVDGAGTVTIADKLATERALTGALTAYNPVTGRPALVFSQGGGPAGYRIVAVSF